MLLGEDLLLRVVDGVESVACGQKFSAHDVHGAEQRGHVVEDHVVEDRLLGVEQA